MKVPRWLVIPGLVLVLGDSMAVVRARIVRHLSIPGRPERLMVRQHLRGIHLELYDLIRNQGQAGSIRDRAGNREAGPSRHTPGTILLDIVPPNGI